MSKGYNLQGEHMAKTQDRITFLSTKQTIDYTTGDKMTEEKETLIKKGAEPPFVKLYLDCLLTFKDLSKSLNPILAEFLRYMSYADMADPKGGQIIYVNGELKRQIALKTNKTTKRVDQALADFVKGGVFKRIATGTYQVNANLFGRGDWKYISNIRATFNFASGEMTAEIEKTTPIEDKIAAII